MKFKIDHDYHIHSKLSLCSNDNTQTAENILKYAQKNNLKEICITDHFWDETVPGASDWYKPQNFEHIKEILPLPQAENIKFFFGCETEMDMHMNIGISDKLFDEFDFVIIPTTHLHAEGLAISLEDTKSLDRRAELYIERLDKLLDKDLPFEKIGIAHLTCPLLAPYSWEDHLEVLDKISDDTYRELFEKIKKKGAGYELNFTPSQYTEEDLPRVLRPYLIAKKVGCKFYLGSDAHNSKDLDGAMDRFNDFVGLLDLTEDDRFRFI